MKKFVNQRLFFWAVLVCLFAGLETPFNTITYSYIFKLISGKSVKMILPTIAAIIVGYGIFTILGYVNSLVINRNIVEINANLKNAYVLGGIKRVQPSDENFESRNLSFFVNDLKLLEDNYWRQIFSLLGAVVMTVGTLAYALYSDVLLTLIFLAFMAIPTFIPRLFSVSIQKDTESWSQKNRVVSSTVQNLFHGSVLLKRYRQENGFNQRLNQAVSGAEHANAKLKNRIALSNGAVNLLFYFCSYVPIGLGIYYTIIGKIGLSQFVAIQYSSSWILNGFNSIVASVNVLNSTKEIRTKVSEATKVDAPEESLLHIKQGSSELLALNDVAFGYDDHLLFKNVTMQTHPGDKVLIKGKSGIGKSSLIKIILKEMAPSSGTSTFGESPYNDEDAYGLFGVVNQTPVIFEDSLRLNVTLGRQASDEQVMDALKSAGLADFSDQQKLDMPISEQGHNLSGGQLKRIEIARAFFFNRRFLLIDEGTASLDEETSKAIHEVLLNNPAITVIEVDHHIPQGLEPLYTKRYDLTEEGLVDSSLATS